MQAEERTRTVIHREWVLDTPAHHTEVTKALTVASQKHDAEPGHASDIVFTHGDDYLIIGYEIEQQHREAVAHGVNETLRVERDEAQRKAEFAMATVKRVRQLAITWQELHAILDGPGDEAEEPDHA